MNSEKVHAAKEAVAAAEQAMKEAYKAIPIGCSLQDPRYLEYLRLKGLHGTACVALSRARYEMRHNAAA